MNLETIQISQLSNDPANVRQHSPRNIEAIKASLRRFGQQIPLVVDAANVVRVGNARLEAMRQLGWTEALVIRSNLSGAELVAYSIADNRTGDPEVGSTFDQTSLADVLASLRAEDEDLAAAAGYTPEELAALLAEQQTSAPAAAPAEFPQVDETIQTDHECPKCKYRWSGSSAPQQEAA